MLLQIDKIIYFELFETVFTSIDNASNVYTWPYYVILPNDNSLIWLFNTHINDR